MQYGQNAITTTNQTTTPEPNFGDKCLVCIEGTPLFKEGLEYYCFADTGTHFWLYIPIEELGIDQVKVTHELKKHFKISNLYQR